MTDRKDFQLAMMRQLGAPLLAAVMQASGDAGPQAAVIAQLLNRAVQLGIGMAQAMDLTGQDGDARLALTAIAADIVAERHKATGRVPDDAELRGLLPSVQALLVFADMFAAGGHAHGPDGAMSSETRGVVTYMEALMPAVAAIAAFSFGRQDQRLAREVAERLSARATAIASTVTGDRDATGLPVLAALAEIYAACHRAEAARLQGLDDDTRAGLVDQNGAVPLDALWADFDRQAAMLEMLGQSFGGEEKSVSGARAPRPEAESRPVAPEPSSPPPPPKPASPMGFFKPGAKPPPIENGDGV